VDELGYLTHAPDAANVLYRVVNERYLKRRPIIFTTNKPLAALGQVLQVTLRRRSSTGCSSGARTSSCGVGPGGCVTRNKKT